MAFMIAFFGIISLVVLGVVYSTLTTGLVFYKFYYWFLLPVFPTMPHITFMMAIGLALFTVVLKNHQINELDDKYKNKSAKYVSVLYPWIILLFGWIIKSIIY